jgi:hypothetical protein
MGRSSRQSFKKRQREIAKRQKKQDKAKRLAARKSGDAGEEPAEQRSIVSEEPDDGEPRLKIIQVGGTDANADKP